MPRLTIQYGPWSPDLANVPFQYNDQMGPLVVPVSDCLNVFYANGTYKSIASPITATINGNTVIVLSTQCLGAFSFYDNVVQQKSVMAGTSTGVNQLTAGGQWNPVPFYANGAFVNMNSASSWSFGQMGPYVFAVPYTPVSNMTGPYLWSDIGQLNGGNTFSLPTAAPGGRIGAAVAQFLMLGDILDAQTQVIGTGDGATINFSALLSNTPMLSTGSVYDANGTIIGTFALGKITGTGLTPAPLLPGFGTLNALGDVFSSPGNIYLNSIFAVNAATDPGQNSFTSITVNSVLRLAASASYSFANGIATWIWTSGAFGVVSGTVYPVTFSPGSFQTTIIAGTNTTSTNGYAPYQLISLYDDISQTPPFNVWQQSVFSLASSVDPTISAFATLKANGVTRTSASATYSYSAGTATWTWNTVVSGAGAFGFANGSTYPVNFTGASFFSTLVAGQGIAFVSHDKLLGFIQGSVGSNSTNVTYNGFQQSSNTGQGAGQSTVNYTTGAINVFTSAVPAVGDTISVAYTQCAPYRVQWSAIGDPTNWPIPLTANAVAFQSGFQDLNTAQGPVMYIAGQPLYGIIFQLTGITRANYVGGNVVFSFALYSENRGLVSRGAAVQVGSLIYFLSQDGWMVTDGNSISPIGTDSQNNAGIDNWFWANVNQAALSAISGAYDDTTRCVYFAIPTGSNLLPDTLLTYNPIANRWTRAAIASELIFTDDNGSNVAGTEIRLGIFTQAHQYSSLLGSTLLGYIESCDLEPVDGMYRITTGARPNVSCADVPKALAGFRNSMQDQVTYTASSVPDPFSRSVPVLQNGKYTRVRTISAAASAMNGATLEQQSGGPV